MMVVVLMYMVYDVCVYGLHLLYFRKYCMLGITFLVTLSSQRKSKHSGIIIKRIVVYTSLKKFLFILQLFDACYMFC